MDGRRAGGYEEHGGVGEEEMAKREAGEVERIGVTWNGAVGVTWNGAVGVTWNGAVGVRKEADETSKNDFNPTPTNDVFVERARYGITFNVRHL